MQLTALVLVLAGAGSALAAGSPATVRLSWAFTVQNDTATPSAAAVVRVLVPVPELGDQQLVSVDAGPGCRAVEDGLGNRAVLVPLGVVPPWGTRVVRLGAVVELRGRGRPERVQGWLADEPLIEVSAPEVQSVARKVRGKTVKATVAAVEKIVAETIKVQGYRSAGRGALWALRNTTGDCTEAACLAVALCRACRIPARMVSGYVVKGDGPLQLERWHDWAEAWDLGWRRVDPGAKREGHYVAFLVHGPGMVLEGARCHVEGAGLTARLGAR